MKLFALLPVKPPVESKSRLRNVLSEGARIDLAWHLFNHVLGIASHVIGAAQSLVISRDSDVLDFASARGTGAVREDKDAGLNAALDLGRSEAIRSGADAILVLPTDLPHLAVDDIDAMIAAATNPPAVVIAPDGRDQGTNALLLSPPAILSFTFGDGSFAAHVAASRQCEVEAAIVRRAGLAFDVDTAKDYARLQQRKDRRAIG